MCDVIDKLTPAQAKEVVIRLSQAGDEIRKVVVAEALNVLNEIDLDDIADEVFLILNSIDVQDCWDRSGGSRDGYTSPDEAAQEIIEEELQAHFDQVQRYHELNMPDQEATYCMGVILGMYRFEHEFKSEFKEWSTDIPADCVEFLLRTWGKRQQETARTDAMLKFIGDRCPAWARIAARL